MQYGDKYSALRPSIFRSGEAEDEGDGALPLLVTATVALEGQEEGEEIGFNPPPLLALEAEPEVEHELDVTRSGDAEGGNVECRMNDLSRAYL